MAHSQAQGSSVTIGVLTDTSRLCADLSGPGAVAAVKIAPAGVAGSLLGKKIELISAAIKTNPMLLQRSPANGLKAGI
jgi:branched-chain amino acid transport system substrate-binding protein